MSPDARAAIPGRGASPGAVASVVRAAAGVMPDKAGLCTRLGSASGSIGCADAPPTAQQSSKPATALALEAKEHGQITSSDDQDHHFHSKEVFVHALHMN